MEGKLSWNFLVQYLLMRSDNRLSVVGGDIFCFKILICFGGLFVDKGASHGGGGYSNKFHESTCI